MTIIASTEALFAWILFFVCVYFMNDRGMVHAHRFTRHRLREHSDEVDEYSDVKLRYRKPHSNRQFPSMTCNCSWGSVPGEEVTTKIVGGKVVGSRENYPMIVGIMDINEECIFCGGTILTEYHVLTAAHCLYEEKVALMSLAIGVKDRCKSKKRKEGQFIRLLETVYIHEYYDPHLNHNDIAIVLPQRKIEFNHKVGPACIHTQPFRSFKEPIHILGWGRVGETASPSPVLLKVSVKRVDTKECRSKVPKGFINNNYNLQLCTYGGDKDACAGDSGGPLFVVDSSVNRLVQVALVSMGKGCARVNMPAVNTALYPYLGWMQWTVEHSMRRHFPDSYTKCDRSFCHINTS